MIKQVYANMPARVEARKALAVCHSAEKILYSTSTEPWHCKIHEREQKPGHVILTDRVAMQDATVTNGPVRLCRPAAQQPCCSTVHCDHLITAKSALKTTLPWPTPKTRKSYDFSPSIQQIRHRFQTRRRHYSPVVLETTLFPAGWWLHRLAHGKPLAAWYDYHWRGIRADACDVMAGLPRNQKRRKMIGVKPTNKLSSWANKRRDLKSGRHTTVKRRHR